jgi:hypothetical protein
MQEPSIDALGQTLAIVRLASNNAAKDLGGTFGKVSGFSHRQRTESFFDSRPTLPEDSLSIIGATLSGSVIQVLLLGGTV